MGNTVVKTKCVANAYFSSYGGFKLCLYPLTLGDLGGSVGIQGFREGGIWNGVWYFVQMRSKSQHRDRQNKAHVILIAAEGAGSDWAGRQAVLPMSRYSECFAKFSGSSFANRNFLRLQGKSVFRYSKPAFGTLVIDSVERLHTINALSLHWGTRGLPQFDYHFEH